MLKNYFKTTLRSFRKNKAFAIINILGLSLGLAAAILILQYAFFELSFDKFHKKSDRIYRVMNERFEGEKLIQRGQITYSAVGPQMKSDFPEIVNHLTLSTFNENVYRWNENTVKVPFTILVEPSFYEMFSFKMLAGNPQTVFDEKKKIVLAESTARILFREQGDSWNEYIGEVVRMGSSEMEFELVGIIEDAPANSSLQYEAILSRSTTFDFFDQAEFGWTGSDYFHYVELAPGIDYKELENKFDDFSQKYFEGDKVTGTFEKFHLQPLEEVYLKSDYEYENHNTSNGEMIGILILIAAFILLMAWVNYINLTTSRSLQRAREVGVRKVVGASRSQLISQFLVESFVLNLLAIVLAVTAVQVFQASYNSLVDRELSVLSFVNYDLNGLPVSLVFLLVFLTGSFVSGIYPAFVLSGFKPSDSLKGEFTKSSQGRLLRRALVVFQFTLSTALIAGTFLVFKQTHFMRNQDLGANLDQVITVEGPSITQLDTTFVSHIQSFIATLESNSRILKAGTSANVFGERLPRVFNVRTSPQSSGNMLNRIDANFGFLEVYDIDLLAGRNFSINDHNKDFNQIESAIINEKAAKLLGFETPGEAVGQKLIFFGKNWKIVGVTANFHHRSLKESIEPLLILPLYQGGGDTYHIKIEGSNIPETLAYIENTYDQFFPGDIFEYSFMDFRFNNQYDADERFGMVFNMFSVLAIAIACLGLFGLVGYTAIKRTKEIGIRKVLGASVSDILELLSKEFLSLILIANCIGLPLIYMAAQSWLRGYAYQTSIGVLFFLLPLILVAIISVLIVVSQTIRVARLNPVNSLRQD